MLTPTGHKVVSLETVVFAEVHMSWLWLIFVVLACTVYAQLVVKARALVHAAQAADTGSLHYLYAMFTDIAVLSGFGAGVLAGVCWLLAIGRIDVGYLYPFVALTFVLVPFGSAMLFGEPLPATQLLGLGLIVAGVIVSAVSR
jgi:drug/metabolite transporter (DMT)-like permease